MNSLPTTTARFVRALPLVLAAALLAYGLLKSAGALGAVVLVAILLWAGALAFWIGRVDPAARTVLRSIANGALLCAPALLIIFFSFSSGGFFPDSVALGALAVGVLLLVRLGLADRPLAAIGPAALVPLLGLAGLAGWTLLSQHWSHAPGRATIAFDRDLLYLLTFALFASIGRSPVRLTWAVRGIALAMVAVAAVALLSKVAPDVLHTAPDPQSKGRLAYPLTYWNGLGVLCAVAAVLCVHLAASDDRWSIRVLSAGALPVVGAALLLTYSRGALAVGVLGLAAYAVLGRPRGLPSALIAAAPSTAIAMKAAYDATLLSTIDPTSSFAVHQGHHLALTVLGCVALAVALRTALLLLDRRLEGEYSPIDRYRQALRAGAVAATALAVAAALALGVVGTIEHAYHDFVHQQTVTSPGVRSRLSSTSNQDRIELWTVAFNDFRAQPIDGSGAETFEIIWYEHRHGMQVYANAHSLYLETLAELGVVGLALVALFVIGTLVGLAPARRGRDRALYAALFSAGLAWAVHAGVDWDWQMPAVSVWFAALGGLALGRPGWREPASAISAPIRAFLAGAAVVGACVFPALVLASQVRLNEATAAYASADCARADKLAQRSIDLLGTRAPPWQIKALCAVRAGRFGRAETDLRGGLAVDPDDWQLQAALAAATAAAGHDARAEVAVARRLNPSDPGVRALAQALAAGPSAHARRAARTFLSQQSLIGSG